MKEFFSISVDAEKIREINSYWNERMPMMAMEEAGELIQSVSKMERKNNLKSRENLVEEIRDMYISLMALQCRYGIDMEEVEDAIKEKICMKKDT